MRAGMPQDKLGVAVGLDEGTASARISRYETGVHEPTVGFSNRIADVLGVPAPYFYCENEDLAAVILRWGELSGKDKQRARDFILALPH